MQKIWVSKPYVKTKFETVKRSESKKVIYKYLNINHILRDNNLIKSNELTGEASTNF